GEITRRLIAAWDAPAPPFPTKEQLEAGKPKGAEAKTGALDPAALGRQLAARALAVKEDKPKLQKVLEEAMAGTDCGDCGYPDCFGYSNAIAQGKDWATDKCAPGGADSKGMLETIIVTLKTGQLPGGAASAPAAPAPESNAAASAPAAAPGPVGTQAPPPA